jgi:hypothetical protein
MDNHFSNILQTFKKLNEGSMKEWLWKEAERLDKDAFIGNAGEYGMSPEEAAEWWDSINGEIEEGSMASAEHRPSGSRFGGYWKGTDKGTPKPGQGVGGMEECAETDSLESRLRARWEKTKSEKGLQEYGMTTGGTTNPQANAGNPVDAQKTAQEINQAQQNLNKLKSAGVTLPQGVSTAAKATVATTNNPAANSTGQGMDQNAKKTAMGLGQEMEKLMATGSQSQVQQVANAIKQAKMGS